MLRSMITLLVALLFAAAGNLAVVEAAQAKKIQNFGARKWTFDEQKYAPRVVDYITDEKPGTIIIDTRRKYL